MRELVGIGHDVDRLNAICARMQDKCELRLPIDIDNEASFSIDLDHSLLLHERAEIQAGTATEAHNLRRNWGNRARNCYAGFHCRS